MLAEIIGSMIFIYCVYQLKRIDSIRFIRKEWLLSDDSLADKYSFDYMYAPAKHNLYGFKYPRIDNFT